MDLNEGGASGAGGESGAAAALTGDEGAGAGSGGSGGEAGAGAGGGSAEGGGAAADPDWLNQLSGEGEGEEPSLRDWAKSAGVKDLNGLAKIARDNMKALRDSGRVKIPGDGASEAEIAEFRKAIGVPDKADEYKLPELKDADGNPLTGSDGKPIEFDKEKVGRIVELAHKNGIPKAALDATLQALAEDDINAAAANIAEINKKAAAHVKTWGADREAKLDAVDLAGRHLELNTKELKAMQAALGPERALDVMAKIGAGLREDTLAGGGAGGRRGFQGDPVAAQRRLDEIKGDTNLAAQARVPGSAINIEYKRLIEIIGEAENRKAAENA